MQTQQASKISEIETQQTEIIKQHLEAMKQMRQLADLQAEIAKQVVSQHQELESLMKVLGLKNDLAYYSYNLHQEEGH